VVRRGSSPITKGTCSARRTSKESAARPMTMTPSRRLKLGDATCPGGLPQGCSENKNHPALPTCVQYHPIELMAAIGPQRVWGEVGAEPPPGPWRRGQKRPFFEESDDEGDLFHQSYSENSCPASQAAPEVIVEDQHDSPPNNKDLYE
jgi:hypothetical protein